MIRSLKFVALLSLICPQWALAQAPSVQSSRLEVVDFGFTFTAPTFGVIPNFSAHAQNCVLTHAGWQYLAYWDHDRRLAIARRRLPAQAWQVVRFEDYRATSEDSHNTVNLGVCPGDGTIHLAFDHHADDLNYRVSIPGLATTPELFPWDETSFGPVTDTLIPSDGPVTKVTYPRFVATPAGDLLLVYREFSSANGRSRLVSYDSTQGSWTENSVWISNLGTHHDPLGGSSDSRNAYFNSLTYDDVGVLHASWTWREKATTRYNRDIAYAYSPDDGRTWLNQNGVVVADSSIGLEIDLNSPDIAAIELGAEWGLMNQQGQAVDSLGRVHVMMYHKTQPDTVVSYGNIFNSKYFHYWRELDGTWKSSQLPVMGDRPKIAFDARDNLLLCYRSAGTLRVYYATPATDFTDWTELYSRNLGLKSSLALDVAAIGQFNALGLAAQQDPAANGDDTRLGVVSIRLQ